MAVVVTNTALQINIYFSLERNILILILHNSKELNYNKKLF